MLIWPLEGALKPPQSMATKQYKKCSMIHILLNYQQRSLTIARRLWTRPLPIGLAYTWCISIQGVTEVTAVGGRGTNHCSSDADLTIGRCIQTSTVDGYERMTWHDCSSRLHTCMLTDKWISLWYEYAGQKPSVVAEPIATYNFSHQGGNASQWSKKICNLSCVFHFNTLSAPRVCFDLISHPGLPIAICIFWWN